MVNTLREIVEALVRKDYLSIGSESLGGRLSAAELETAIREYGADVTPIPDDILEQLEVIPVENAEIPTWFIDLDLWINGKQSDLTLSMEMEQNRTGKLTAKILDLHVL